MNFSLEYAQCHNHRTAAYAGSLYKKGLMLDTGHFMNSNYELETPTDALAYLHQMLYEGLPEASAHPENRSDRAGHPDLPSYFSGRPAPSSSLLFIPPSKTESGRCPALFRHRR